MSQTYNSKTDKEVEKIIKRTEKIEPVLIRTWIPETEKDHYGVIDIECRIGDSFIDAAEAEIKKDQNGVPRLYPRGRDNDIPEDWFPVIESSILYPLSWGNVQLLHQHLFGKGEIHKIVHRDTYFSELKLKNLEVISPEEYVKLKNP